MDGEGVNSGPLGGVGNARGARAEGLLAAPLSEVSPSEVSPTEISSNEVGTVPMSEWPQIGMTSTGGGM